MPSLTLGTVLGLRVSWEQSSPLGGEKGERKEGVKGRSGEGNLNAMKKKKVHRKAVDEQDLILYRHL